MKEGTIKNILDAVRDWVNNKEQAYKPGEIYESVPNEIIKMLWDGDTKFDDLVPVSGANELNPVSKLENYLHFINIFYDIEEIKQNALTFTNIGDEDESFRFHLEVLPGFTPTLFLIEDDDLVPFELEKLYTIPAHSEIKIVGYNPTGKVGFQTMWYFDAWYNNSNINISGKLTSLIDVVGQLDILPDTADFSSLFKYSPVVDASGLILPNNVTPACYSGMFSSCHSLIGAPVLPATVLAEGCYSGMFSSCHSLIGAPVLPATVLAGGCYSFMFAGCRRLIHAPNLQATTLIAGCYNGMFTGCVNLIKAPELQATTLVSGCYNGMFTSCRSLNYIKCLAVNGIDGGTNNWVLGVANKGTFVKHPSATDWSIGNNGIPTNWEVEDDVINYFGFRIVGDDREDIHLHMGVRCVNYFEDTHYNIEYSYDTITWHTLIDQVCDNNTYMIPNPDKGEYHKTVYFRGNNREQFYKNLDGDITSIGFVTNDLYNLEVFGDITTLLRPEGKVRDLSNWFNKPSYESESETFGEPIYRSAFSNIFSDSTNLRENLVSADKLILYPKVLTEYCYGMAYDATLFHDCSILTVPKLPATTLARGCYSYMFQGCTSLTTAPVLPAKTLAEYCYSSMFYNCTGLTAAPELPATTLVKGCYSSMFYRCSSLATTPTLPATTLADSCYYNMFGNCSSLTEAPELPATELAEGCYSSMFYRCSSLATAPTLPATTLADSCYSSMFSGCSSLATAPTLPATTLADSCYKNMFLNCTSLTTTPNLPATTLADSCYYNMFFGCSNLTEVPTLPATTLAYSCYQSMFYNCSSLTTIPDLLPATTLANSCYQSMFWNCSSLTEAPELPATTLTDYCYYGMFWNCSSLNYIKCLAINGINQNSSTTNWTNAVQTNSGVFIKHPNSIWPNGSNGTPINWTVEDANL